MFLLRLAFLLLVSLSLAAHAAPIYVDASATGTASGKSWKDAFPNLQDALAAARNNGEVRVAAGVYFPDIGERVTLGDAAASFALAEGVQIHGGFKAGGSDTADPRVQITILSGDIDHNDPSAGGVIASSSDITGKNSVHVVSATGVDQSAVLNGFVITGGDADLSGSGSHGGGLIVIGGAPGIERCRFIGNRCVGRGGAVHLDQTSSTFLNCDFRGNSCAARGGAVGTVNNATPAFTNCAFIGNLAQRGGALNANNSTIELINCSFSGNSGTVNGGAIQSAAGSTLNIVNTLIWNNHAAGSAAAAGSSINLISGSSRSRSFSSIEGDTGSDPQFRVPPNPALAPSSGGDLRLGGGSPAVELGDNTANTSITDLDGNPRVVGDAIDLGAFERPPVTFYVDAGASGANNGSSWPDAFVSLQDALTSSLNPGDSIRIASGVYYPDEGGGSTDNDRDASFLLVEGVSLLGGHPTGGGPRDPSVHLTILSGDIQQDDVDPDLDGIPATGSDIVGENSRSVLRQAAGAGNLLSSATLVEGLVITAGFADVSVGPQTETRSGGGLYLFGGSPVIRNCRFVANRADTGGGLYSFASPAGEGPFIDNCRFEGNLARSGGAIFFDGGGTRRVRNSSFENNHATFIGGALLTEFASPTFVNCRFAGNTCASDGGAVHARMSSELAFVNCTFSGNACPTGSGAALQVSAPVSLINCTLTGNLSGGLGGGAINKNGGALTITNTVIWNNQHGGVNGPDRESIVDTGGSLAMWSNSLIENYGLTLPRRGNLDGTDPANNPLFATPLAPASAPTTLGDVSLLAGSPAQSVGDNSANSESLDLAGNFRISGAFIDLGAYEIQLVDQDRDGLSDTYELAHTSPPSATALLPQSNTDGDAFPAIIEFALGLDPNQADDPAAGFTYQYIPGSNLLLLFYTPNPDAAHYTRLFVEGSKDLGFTDPWRRSTSTPTGNGGELRAASASIFDTYFLRFGVDY